MHYGSRQFAALYLQIIALILVEFLNFNYFLINRIYASEFAVQGWLFLFQLYFSEYGNICESLFHLLIFFLISWNNFGELFGEELSESLKLFD